MTDLDRKILRLVLNDEKNKKLAQASRRYRTKQPTPAPKQTTKVGLTKQPKQPVYLPDAPKDADGQPIPLAEGLEWLAELDEEELAEPPTPQPRDPNRVYYSYGSFDDSVPLSWYEPISEAAARRHKGWYDVVAGLPDELRLNGRFYKYLEEHERPGSTAPGVAVRFQSYVSKQEQQDEPQQ